MNPCDPFVPANGLMQAPVRAVRTLFCLLALGCLTGPGVAQTLPPASIQYQGRVTIAGSPHHGTGHFKFLLYAPDKRLWSNDDSHPGAQPLADYEPAGSVAVPVSQGLFSIELGTVGMPAITPEVFFDSNGNVRSDVSMRVWFRAVPPTLSDSAFARLSPDRKFASVPFSLVAGTVAKSAATADKLAADAVTADKIRNGAVVAGKLGTGALAEANLQADAVTRDKIQDGEITAGKLEAGAALTNLAPASLSATRLAPDAALSNLASSGVAGVSGGGIILSQGDNPMLAAQGFVMLGMMSAGEAWWPCSTMAAPPSRHQHGAVWTGSEMIIWGGRGENQAMLGDGARYTPQSGAWSAMSGTGAPSPRYRHSVVWTGVEVIVWGGIGSNGQPLGDGGRYNPQSDVWTELPSTLSNTPSPRSSYSVVWSGTEMIVWGGRSQAFASLNDGGRYNPQTNAWTPIAGNLTGTPAARYSHSAVYDLTSGQMLIWGGYTDSGITNTGGRYQPLTNSWTGLTTSGAPSARSGHSAILIPASSEMVIWGGAGTGFDFGTTPYYANGGRYKIQTNSWTAIADAGVLSARAGHSAVWTGTEMTVWGGSRSFGNIGPPTLYPDGARYNPSTGQWAVLAAVESPAARVSHTAVWTGNEMVVWGGGNYPSSALTPLGDGFRWAAGRTLSLYSKP